MIALLFVGDGPRDPAVIPHLVGNILKIRVDCHPTSWSRLHQSDSGSGYRRKIRFAMLQAKDAGLKGLVATVDTDRGKARDKLKDLKKAREEARKIDPTFPIVLGEANPHAEAWLLDDKVAIGKVLEINADDVPNIRKSEYPKDTIETLRADSCRRSAPILEVLSDIAVQVDVARCRHQKETGFEDFVDDLRIELTPLCKTCGPDCLCGDCT
jgi:hypothetical protein